MSQWPMRQLGEVAQVVMGQSPLSETYNTRGVGIPFFQGKAEFGEESPVTAKWCSQPTRIAESGDILLSVRAPVGPTNYASERCCIGRGLAAIRGNLEHVHQRYVGYFLKRFESELARRGVGSTFSAITRRDIESMLLPVPPLAEQERIVRLLDDADAIRKLRAQADQRTADLIPALFHDMFGDPVTNPMGWPVDWLGNRLAFLTSGSRGWARYYSESGTPFLRIQNVGFSQLLLDDLAYVTAPPGAEAMRTTVQCGDVLLSVTADLGRSAVVPDGFPTAHINQHLALLRLTKINPNYVSAYLSFGSGREQMLALNRGGVKSGLNFDDIRSLRILVPPDHIQADFAYRVEATRSLLVQQVQSGIAGQAMIDAMLNRAFNDRL